MTRVDLPGQSVIFRAGDPGDAMFLVLDGMVRLSSFDSPEGARKPQAVVKAGEFFGDMALLDHDPHVVQGRDHGGRRARAHRQARASRKSWRLAPHVVPLNFVRTVHARVKASNRHYTEEILRGERLYHVGTMTGSIIHDFKNPLTAIRCACDLLEARDHDETPPACRRDHQAIRRAHDGHDPGTARLHPRRATRR